MDSTSFSLGCFVVLAIWLAYCLGKANGLDEASKKPIVERKAPIYETIPPDDTVIYGKGSATESKLIPLDPKFKRIRRISNG